jgi:hypothetical protein
LALADTAADGQQAGWRALFGHRFDTTGVLGPGQGEDAAERGFPASR